MGNGAEYSYNDDWARTRQPRQRRALTSASSSERLLAQEEVWFGVRSHSWIPYRMTRVAVLLMSGT